MHLVESVAHDGSRRRVGMTENIATAMILAKAAAYHRLQPSVIDGLITVEYANDDFTIKTEVTK